MRYLLLIAILLASTPALGQAVLELENGVEYLLEVRVRKGDDPRFASPSYDDGGWPVEPTSALPRSNALQWMRAPVRFPKGSSQVAMGLKVTVFGAWELFLDGVRLGGSGVVGTAEESEELGTLDRFLVIPPELATEGEHLLAIRCSSFADFLEGGFPRFNVHTGPYETLIEFRRRRLVLAAVHISALLLVAVWALGSWAIDRFWPSSLSDQADRSSLWLGGLALATLAYALNLAWRRQPDYSLVWQELRALLLIGSMFCRALCLVAFVITRFSLGNLGRALMAALLVLAPVLYFTSSDYSQYLVLLEVLGLSLAGVAALVGLRQRRWTLAALGLPVAVSFSLVLRSPVSYGISGLFWGADLFFATLLVVQAVETRRVREDRLAAQHRSKRLELEVLRRHLQPHFLMNTLTALSEHLIDDPERAEDMIEALSEEVRLLGHLSQFSLIRLEEELRLCRAHLEVMSFRRARSFRLAAPDDCCSQAIPPAVLHTLIENALSHNRYPETGATFRLSWAVEESRFSLAFRCPSTRAGAEATGGRGTGRRYIEARLEESFPGHWAFEEGREGSEWVARMEIPRLERSAEPA